jgi:hypothetical protein
MNETSNELVRHPDVSEITAQRLLTAVAAVKKDAKRFDMNYWLRQTDTYDPSKRLRRTAFTLTVLETVHYFKERHSKCGTTCCFASFILETAPPEFLKEVDASHIEWAAAEYAQLSDFDKLILFRLGFWPAEYMQAYDKAETPEAAAEALEARVRRFIQTGE